MTPPVGLLLGTAVPPEDVRELAAAAERLGFAELWYSEHYFHSGGIAGMATALAATDSVPVGLAIAPATSRPHAVLAMELAALARMYPGRVRAGVGAGEPGRVADIGGASRPPLARTRACVEETRRLLAGEALGAVELAFPAPGPVDFYVGAAGPAMLRLSGAIADGTVLSLVKGAAYVAWAVEQVAAGAAAAARTAPHRIVSLAAFAVDADGERARAAVRPLVAAELARGPSVFTDADGTSGAVAELLDRGGPELLERELPDEWLADLAVAGDPAECAAAIRRQLDAGADAVALLPIPVVTAGAALRAAVAGVLPLLAPSATPQGA